MDLTAAAESNVPGAVASTAQSASHILKRFIGKLPNVNAVGILAGAANFTVRSGMF